MVERCKRKALLSAQKGRAERIKAILDGAGVLPGASEWQP